MIEITQRQLFGKVIAEALAATENNSGLTSGLKLRWINAIGKAARQIEENPYLTWMPERGGYLLVYSIATSQNIYEANGSCQCEAYHHSLPCWHRAAAKLVRNYYAALDAVLLEETIEEPDVAAPAAPLGEFNNSPYLRPDAAGKKRTRIGGIRI